MGKFLMGLFFVLMCIFLALSVYNGAMKQEVKFGTDVKEDISELYKDPATTVITAP